MAMGLIQCLVWLICFLIRVSSESDDVSVLKGWDLLSPSTNRTIVSAGGVFELGFFNPDPSRGERWYVGIWYKNIPEAGRRYVWVANRDNPLNNYNGTLGISGATLVIRDPSDNNRIVWSSTSFGSGSPVAKLLDSGNFVLMNSNDEDPGDILWQSFDYPTDTLLPGMKLGSDPDVNERTAHINRVLTSWKNAIDPSRGNYTLSLERRDESWGLSIMGSGNKRMYSSGPWNGAAFFRLPRPSPRRPTPKAP
ncbi:unnamed protein product [Microthlaspi erraticum]|uniref:Bulb-type lectin domain-containing protein n=1 Tax=Microthlaspi erraticum TaxID=1685480 RepID=A0A6D2HDV1_9BRAS|nr:unnamed protein product [Microthlaspi erraticum]CAA7058479.1 unnamed protein product [Microthlaspi erraticum]